MESLNQSLIVAAAKGNLEKVKELINKGADVYYRLHGDSAMMRSLMNGHLEIVEYLFEIDGRDVSELLLHAAEYGHTDIVELLLKKGADIEYKDGDGDNALMLSTMNGNTETVGLLLDSGAGIEVRNNSGSTALIYAARQDHVETVSLLLERGANIDVMDDFGTSPLAVAKLKGNEGSAAVLNSYMENRSLSKLIRPEQDKTERLSF